MTTTHQTATEIQPGTFCHNFRSVVVSIRTLTWQGRVSQVGFTTADGAYWSVSPRARLEVEA